MISAEITVDGVESTDLIPISFDRVLAPALNKIQLLRQSGKYRGTQAPCDIAEEVVVPYVDIRNKTIEVNLQDDQDTPKEDYFCAVVIEDSEKIRGVNQDVRLSDDTYTAFGFEYFLQKNKILDSTLNGGTIIKRALPFNYSSNGDKLVGNKSTADNTFAPSLDSSEEWTGLNVVQYLLDQFNSKFGIQFTLAGQFAQLSQVEGAWSAHNKDYWTLINEIINPRSGFCFFVDMGVSGHELVVRTVVSSDIGTEGGGFYLPANDDQSTVNLGTSHNSHDVSLDVLDDSYYGKIITRGGRHIFTATFTSSQFVNGWTEAEENEYNNASTTDETRKKKLAHVFTRFYLDPAWTGDIGSDNAIPVIKNDGTIDTVTKQDFYYPTFRFLRNLAVLDADDQAIAPFATMDDTDDNTQLLHNPAEGLPPVSFQVLTDKPGIQFRSKIPHVIAESDFSGESEISPSYDFNTMKVTLSYMLDESLQIEESIDVNFDKTLLMDHPEIKNSIIINSTELPDRTVGSNEFAENGFSKLQNLSELAKSWHGQRKARISFKYPDAKINEKLGVMVTTASIGSTVENVDTVVSRVIYNWTYGPNRGATTQISTQFFGIDLNALSGRRQSSNISDIRQEVNLLRKEVNNTPSQFPLGSGASSTDFYCEITASTDANTYTVDIYDNPTDRNLIAEDVTVKAVRHHKGTLKNSPDGKGEWGKIVNGVYYLTSYSVYHGGA